MLFLQNLYHCYVNVPSLQKIHIFMYVLKFKIIHKIEWDLNIQLVTELLC